MLSQVSGVTLVVTWHNLDVLHIFTDSYTVGVNRDLSQHPSEAEMVP